MMKQTPALTEKRVIPKRNYFALMMKKLLMGMSSVGLAVVTAFCVIAALASLLAGLIMIKERAIYSQAHWGIVLGLLSVPLGAIAMYLKYIAEKEYEKATQRENVIPLTRSTAGQLRVEESLVRSSKSPLEAQSDILLRMATQAQNIHQEQLVRPVVNEEV